LFVISSVDGTQSFICFAIPTMKQCLSMLLLVVTQLLKIALWNVQTYKSREENIPL